MPPQAMATTPFLAVPLLLSSCGGTLIAYEEEEIFAPLCPDLTTITYDVTLYLAVPEGVDAKSVEISVFINSGSATFEVATTDGESMGKAALDTGSAEANNTLTISLPLPRYDGGDGRYEVPLVVTASGEAPATFDLSGVVAYPKSGCDSGPAPELTLEVSPREHESDTGDTGDTGDTAHPP